MKRTIRNIALLLILTFIGITPLSAQVSKNIVDTTKVWHNWEVVTNGIRTNSYKISSEQVELNEILYNKVLQQYHSDFLLDEDFSYKGILIREDSGKVYILFEQHPDTELLLYDFNAEKDAYYKIPYIAMGILSTDSFDDYKNGFVVTSVDSIEIDNQQLKRITLTPTSDNNVFHPQIQWIEGIGSTMGFIDNFYGIEWGNSILRCCTQDNELIYYNNDYISGVSKECIYYSSIDNIYYEDINIFPNPANNYITVTSTARDCKLLLYDGFGRIVRNVILNDTDVINIENITSGTYTAVILHESKIVKTEKIIKL